MATFAQSLGDLQLTSGNLVLITDPDVETAQKLANLFKSFQGEWFMDTRIGVPWFQAVFVKNPKLRIIRQLFRQIILSQPRVLKILNLDLNLLPTRELDFNFTCTTNTGAKITGGAGIPFVVTVPQ